MVFYTTTQNSRGKEVTAGAHKGQTTHTRTWTHGVEIESISYGTQKNKPVGFSVYMTRGSDNPGSKTYLGEVMLDKKGNPEFKKAKKWQNG